MPQTLRSHGGTLEGNSICAQCSTCSKMLCHERSSFSEQLFIQTWGKTSSPCSVILAIHVLARSIPSLQHLLMLVHDGIYWCAWNCELIHSLNAVSHHQHTGGRWKLNLQHLISCHCWRGLRAETRCFGFGCTTRGSHGAMVRYPRLHPRPVCCF